MRPTNRAPEVCTGVCTRDASTAHPAHPSRSTKRSAHGFDPFSSPGWTRTNNPPVNSRMLCQLSYRGPAVKRRRSVYRALRPSTQCSGEASRGGLGVGCLADGADDGDARRAPAATTSATFDLVDPTDREPRQPRVRGGVAHELEPDRGTALLRRRRVHGAHADVVGIGRVDLSPARGSRGRCRAPKRFAKRDRQVVLAEVDEVRTDYPGEINAVVDDEAGCRSAA